MYGSENWALIRSERRKIDTADMRFLRCLRIYFMKFYKIRYNVFGAHLKDLYFLELERSYSLNNDL
jgi:hypothetical protein